MAKKPWIPPAKLQPITAPIYAMLRVYIDTGNLAVQHFVKMRAEGCKDECWVDPQPSCEVMAATLYKFLPTSAVPLGPAQDFAKVYYPDDPARYPDTDSSRIGWATFVDRDALIAGLDAATPPAVLAELGPLNRNPEAGAGEVAAGAGGPAEEAVSWWMVALGAGGFLAAVGKLKMLAIFSPTKKVMAVVAIVATALKYAGLTGLVANIWEGAKEAADQALVKPLAKGTTTFAYIFGAGAAFLGIGILVTKFRKPAAPAPRLGSTP